MTRVSELIDGWFGWCPHAGNRVTAQPGLPVPSFGNPAVLPDGGSPGSGRIRRGTGIAAASLNLLAGNPRLLGFSFLIFLTFVAAMGKDLYLPGISGAGVLSGATDAPALLRAGLGFSAAFLELFVFFFLAAGLIASVSQIPEGKPVSLREGLCRAWQQKRPLAGWTLIGAFLWILAGPFTAGFFLVTVFALPLMVPGNNDLPAALRGSIAVFRRMWVETYVSFGILLVLSLAVVFALLFVLGQAASAYGISLEGIPGILIGLVVPALMAVGLVVMGIATWILYISGKPGVLRDG